MTFYVKKPMTLLFSLLLSIATIAIMGSTVFADDYDADTVDVIDIENLPWGVPNQQEAATEKSTGKETFSPTDFLNESEFQAHKRTLTELNQVLKTIYDRNPSYLSQLAMFKVSTATRLYNAFIYNRGAFFIGKGFWNALQTPDARAFVILNAITWKKNKGPDKAQKVSLHSKIGAFPGGFVLLFATSLLSLPYSGWATYQAYKGYPNFIYKTDIMTLDQLEKLGYDPIKAIEALTVLDDTDAFSFLDQSTKTYYEAQTGRSVYNPSNYRLLKQGFTISVPKPEKRYEKLSAYLAKQVKTSVNVTKKP